MDTDVLNTSEDICILPRGVQYLEDTNMLQVSLKFENERVYYLTFFLLDFLPS